jgi:hypothetical protein
LWANTGQVHDKGIHAIALSNQQVNLHGLAFGQVMSQMYLR